MKQKTNYGQALCFVSFNETKTICIYYNKYFIYFNTFMIICFIIKIHCKRLLQIQNLHGVFTVCTRRAQNAPRALLKTPQRCHSVLFDTLWKRQAAEFVFRMLKINTTAWRSRRLHVAFPQRCWRLHSAHLGVLQFYKTLWERCKDATLV